MKVLMCTDCSKFSEEAIESGGYLLKNSDPEATILRVVPDFEKVLKEAEEGNYNMIVLASYGRGISKE